MPSSRIAHNQPINPLWVPGFLLFISGAAALVYQVLWVKQLSLVVGVEVFAITTAISAFFAGLGLGGLVFGRLADRSQRPVLLYAALELCVAFLAVVTTLSMPHSAGLFARLEDSLGLLAWLLPLLLVGVPAFFMGGTLPVLIRSTRPDGRQMGRAGGGLYAANTAGAIVGTLLTAFWLIPTLGVSGSAYAAAAANLLAALLALGSFLTPVGQPLPKPPFVVTKRSADARLATALYCLAGGVALGYEVIWTQSIVQFMSTRTFAFAMVLATYLFGLVLGSAWCSRRADRFSDPWGSFALLLVLAGLVALLQIAGLGQWLIVAQSYAERLVLDAGGNQLLGMCARFLVAAFCVVFLPTTLLGAAFPLALRLAVDAQHVGRDVGWIVALNTLGGILGVAITGFLLIPAMGLLRGLAVLAFLAAMVALVAVWRGTGVTRNKRLAVIFLGSAILLVGALVPRQHLAELLPAARNGQISFYQEGRGGTVAVVQQGKGQNRFSRLYIQGVSNTGDAMPSLRYMRLQALIPLLIHKGEPDSSLVIGFGTGITAGAMLRYQGLQHPVVAELLPEVLAAAPYFRGTFNAIHDPRLEIRLRDGRRELLRSAEHYDIITLEPPPPSAAGVVNLYSRDFYQLAASRLAVDGVVAQWLPLPTQNNEDSRSLVRSFIDVFPYASLWTTEFHEMLLVGSLQPLQLDVPRIQQRFEQPEIRTALAEVGIDSAQALLATWITDRKGLAIYAGNADPVTDDQPRIEYAPWVRPREIIRTLPELLALRSSPHLQGAEESFQGAVNDQWQRLRSFYQLSLHAYRDDREAWARDLRQMSREAEGNPYFQWFIGSP